MINKAYSYLRQRPAFLALLVIFLLGVFLRSYHFSDWLHFELDQSRDAKVIDLAIKEGPSNLPLLGPKAAGSFLRLGPLFYYSKYLSALVFGNTPSGIAVIIMLFGIAAVPVFYLFIKRYFQKYISLGLTLLFSVSIFLVMYSRFSWNPNPLALFVLLSFYSLLRVADKSENKKGIWLLVLSFSVAAATQMHFLAFAAVPAITVIFLIIKRPRIKLIYWAGAALIFLFLYAPAIINDFKTGGDNIKQFAEVVSGKSGKSDHNIVEKVIRNYSQNSLGYLLLVSGKEKQELPAVTFGFKNQNLKCDKGCKNGIGLGILAFLFFTAGIIFLAYNLRKEKNPQRKDFLLLTALWFLLVFGLYTPISYNIAPRFWLLVCALPFIFLGFILEFLAKKYSRFSRLVYAVIAILAFLNLWAVKQRFWQLANAPYQSFEIAPDRILKERTRVTLEQQNLIMDYIENIYNQNHYPVYLNSESFYRRSLLYDLDRRNIPENDFRNAENAKKIYAHGNYFLVQSTDSNISSDIAKYTSAYSVKETKIFGTLTVIRFVPQPEAVNAVEEEIEPKGGPSKSAPGVPVRYRWEEIFNDSAQDEVAN